MKLLGKLLAYPIWAVNWAISLLMVFSCYGSLAAPVGKWPFASLSGLAFPYLFAANFLFLIFYRNVIQKTTFSDYGFCQFFTFFILIKV